MNKVMREIQTPEIYAHSVGSLNPRRSCLIERGCLRWRCLTVRSSLSLSCSLALSKSRLFVLNADLLLSFWSYRPDSRAGLEYISLLIKSMELSQKWYWCVSSEYSSHNGNGSRLPELRRFSEDKLSLLFVLMRLLVRWCLSSVSWERRSIWFCLSSSPVLKDALLQMIFW